MRAKPATLLPLHVPLAECGRANRCALAVLLALAIWPIGIPSQPAFAQQVSPRRSAGSDAKCEVITQAEVQRIAAGGNLIDVLRSRFPGLQVNPSGWTSRSSSSFGLRGRNSVVGSNEPLIFLDGMRLPQPGGLSQLELIEPLHVQRMEILPGPATTTFYGTGASNGVVLVYTQGGSNALRSDPRGGCLP